MRSAFFLAAFAPVFLLAGCDSATPPSSSAPSGGRAVKLLDAGGSGQDVTVSFPITTRALKVDYRVSRMPSDRQATFTLERARTASGQSDSDPTDESQRTFETGSGVSDTVPESLSGSKTLPTFPGRYRLRVSIDATWSVVIYELK